MKKERNEESKLPTQEKKKKKTVGVIVFESFAICMFQKQDGELQIFLRVALSRCKFYIGRVQLIVMTLFVWPYI